MNDLQIFEKNIEKIQLPLKESDEIVNLIMYHLEKLPFKLTDRLLYTKLKVGDVLTVRYQIQRMFRIILLIEG